MNKTNNTNQSGGIFVKVALLAALFLGAVTGVWALPGTGSTNLQTTAGVTTSVNGGTLAITAPDKAVLTWQAFGSGTDTIGAGDTISYTLPSSKSSVLNVVAGNAVTAIDGYLTSNGNVFVLNPNGIVIGGSARIDTNAAYFSTSDIPSFAAYYFQQNGKLPSQDKLAAVAGTTTIGNNALINVTDNITILSKNVDVAGALIQSNLNIIADGNVTLGSSGFTVAAGSTTVTNPTGTTTLGAAGSVFTSNNNVTVNTTTGTVGNNATTTFNVKALTVNAGTGDVNLGKVGSSSITVAGNNVAVGVGAAVNPVVTVTANGTVAITAPSAVTANVTNTNATANTSVVAAGALTLGTVQINSAGNTTFTGTSVTDSINNNFVYGPVLFNATAGDVSITKSGNSFGPVSVATVGTATATVYEGAALNLGTVNVSKLTAKTGEFAIQTGVVTTPSLNLIAAGNITLANVANNVGGLVATGANVAFTSTGAVTLGNVDASGTLAVVSGGAITQATGATVKAVGAATLTGTALTLANAGNNFGALTLDANTGNVTLAEDTTINIAGLRAGTSSFTSNGSVITTGTAAINTGNVAINAGADVILTTNFNTTGTLTINAINGVADLSLLSFGGNLHSVFPSVVAKNYKAPTP